MKHLGTVLICSVALYSCTPTTPVDPAEPFEHTLSTFGADFPIDPPLDYSGNAPAYIAHDVLNGSDVDDRRATLGRVLFYDKQLSLNNTIACASCHLQSQAFSDTAWQSVGFEGGLTGRHSMRLINLRYGEEEHLFWDERALDAEDQVTQPIQDHIEMGFSGAFGQPGFDSLEAKLAAIGYYPELFAWAFDGDSSISQPKIAQSLAAFVLSIESFDSKFDQGLAQTGQVQVDFPNFTPEENQGKALFLAPPALDNQGNRIDRGAGCAGCHRPPTFDIDPNSLNNGVFHVAGDPSGIDLSNTRSPSLRDVLGPDGLPNARMMHTGDFVEFETVLEHYDRVFQDVDNTNLDPRLHQGPNDINLHLSTPERLALEAFIKTLTGQTVYTEERWSDPF